MRARTWFVGPLAFSAVSIASACSSSAPQGGFGEPDTDAGSGGGSTTDSGPTTTPISFDSSAPPTLGQGEAGPAPAGTCNVTDPNADADKDGWSIAQGDCNDCDPNVNPGAIDVLKTNDGGAPTWGDEDCDGMPGDSAQACDMGLALTDVDAADGAKAIELCRTATMADRKYGVLSANYVHSDGSAFASPGTQVGIQGGFGPNVHVQGGQNMLALSTGAARVVGQTGACGKLSCCIDAACTTKATAVPLPGFPQEAPPCSKTAGTTDDVAFELQVRAPSNATGYSFNFKFYSFEFPNWVCDQSGYNDQFIALVTPPPLGAYVPTGSTGGNISFDSNNNPVSVNLGFFDVCDGNASRFAVNCGKVSGATCPPVPMPYCPSGVGELAGTGFDVWDTKTGEGPAGATKWLQTKAPV
ncbi:MAG TPA: hypothetical protein VGI39_35080, partial [Polyangiaceae bacterium]